MISRRPSPRPSPRKRGAGGVRVGGGVKGGRATIISAIVLSLALAGCGKRNAPLPPPDEPSTYPRAYPSE